MVRYWQPSGPAARPERVTLPAAPEVTWNGAEGGVSKPPGVVNGRAAGMWDGDNDLGAGIHQKGPGEDGAAVVAPGRPPGVEDLDAGRGEADAGDAVPEVESAVLDGDHRHGGSAPQRGE